MDLLKICNNLPRQFFMETPSTPQAPTSQNWLCVHILTCIDSDLISEKKAMVFGIHAKVIQF